MQEESRGYDAIFAGASRLTPRENLGGADCAKHLRLRRLRSLSPVMSDHRRLFDAY